MNGGGGTRIEIYKRPNGDRPFTDWMAKLRDQHARARISARLARVRTGNFGDCHPVGDSVAEFRIDEGPGYRVYFGRLGALVVLLCGGSKRTQTADIQRAKEYLQDYLQRRKQEAEDEKDG